MTPSIALVLALIFVVSVVLISDKLRPDLAALLLLVTLGLTGLVDAQDLFSGFSRAAVITIMALFILTAGLERTGATRILGNQLNRLAGKSEPRVVLVVMVAAAALSLVMNNIAVAAVLLPAVIGLARHTSQQPSRLLMPLAFGTLLGGMATLFTTANILVSAALAEHGYRPYSVFDFLPVGLPMAAVGIAFMAWFGRRLLPYHGLGGETRNARDLSEAYGLRQTVNALRIKPGSAMAGLSLAEGCWGEKLGLNVVGISRRGAVKLAPARQEEVLEGDVILFTGYTDDEELQRYGLALTHDSGWQGQFTSEQVNLVEVALSPHATFIGQTLREIAFREKYELTVLAIWREGHTIRDGLADIPLRFGDALLLQGRRAKIALLRRTPDFLVLEEDVGAIESPRKALLAVTLTTAAVLLPAFNILPIAESTFTAACLMILFNCLSMDEAYAAIEWKAIFLIAGMLPLGLAMTNTGAAAFVGEALVSALGGLGPLAVAAGLYLLTTALTQVIGGQVTPVVLAPIAVAAAQHIGADPRGVAMAVALGASTAFLSPLSHSVNLLVMGPGGYQFKNYARVGWRLTVVLFGVLLAALAAWGVR
jgi:di/tricarboxylate transporter